MAWVAFLALLASTAALRIGEALVSYARLRGRDGELVSERWLFPLMALLHAAFVLLPAVEVIALDRPFVPWLAALALGAFGGATALRIWTLAALGGSWNVRVVRPRAVVTDGPYRWIRHPNYLVVIVEIASLPLVHGAWMSAVALSALNAFVLFHRIRTEERTLSEIPAWRDAMADRPRLLPLAGPRRHRATPS